MNITGNFMDNISKDNILKLEHEKVSEVIIGIKPVDSIYQTLLNVATKGEMKKRLEQMGISDLIHPFVIFKFENTQLPLYVYERVDRINFEQLGTLEEDTKVFQPPTAVGKRLGVLIQNHINYLGGTYDSIIKYDPQNQNSQIFVKGFLDSNNLNDKKLQEFYKQPTEKIMKGFTKTNELVNKITMLGLAVDILMGNGY